MESATASTFAEFARSVASRFVPEETVQTGLQALGGKAEWQLSSLDSERRSTMISHFVRSMRNLGVHTASRVEGAMLAEAGCRASGCRVLVIKDAISLIAVRNLVHQTITALGAGWNGSMRYQSALSDIARFIIERGGGRIELEESHGGLHFAVYTAQDLGHVSTAAGAAPAWLAATLSLSKDVRVGRSGSGSLIEIKFEKPKAMVA
jgi:hypothetical protein